MFREIPRYSQRYQPAVFLTGHHSRAKIPCIRRALKSRAQNPHYTRWINVRHPLSRLLSAWRQKFDKNYKGIDEYMKYVSKIKIFESDPDYTSKNSQYVASLSAFLSYVANVASDQYYNEHWRRLVNINC